MIFYFVKWEGETSVRGRLGMQIGDIIESLETGLFKCEIKPVKKKTLEQLGYYWGAILPYLAEEFGYLYRGIPSSEAKRICEEIHEELTKLLAPTKETKSRLRPGSYVESKVRLSEMDRSQAAQFITDVVMKFPELSIPLPNSPNAMAFYDKMIDSYHVSK